MSSPAKKRNEVAPRSPLRSPSKTQNEPTYMNLRSLQPPTPKSPLSPLLLPAFWSNTPLSQSFAASPPGAADEQDKENGSRGDNDVFKKPLPPPYSLATQKKASSVSLTMAAMTKEGGGGDRDAIQCCLDLREKSP